MQRSRTAGLPARAAALVIAAMAALGACGDTAPTDAERADTVAALLDSGMASQEAGEADDATAAYMEVLAVDPTNKFALYNLGTIEQAAGRDAEAEPRYRAALATDPDFGPALFNLAIIRSASAPLEAADLYRRAIEQDPGRAGAWFNLGEVQRTLGQDAEAEQSFARARELDPSLEPPT